MTTASAAMTPGAAAIRRAFMHMPSFYRRRLAMRALAVICITLGLLPIDPAQSASADRQSAHKTFTAVPLIHGTKTRLLDIPLAENTLFTDDGRLFVSGGQNVYEVLRDSNTGTGFRADPLFTGTDNFTGMAQIGDTLYASSYSGLLYAASLSQAPMQLRVIAQLNMDAANGMTTDGTVLYMVNGPLPSDTAPNPTIERVSFATGAPMTVVEDLAWLNHGLFLPNGIKISGRTLYVTDSSLQPLKLGVMKRIDINADGTPGAPTLFALVSSGILDDFSIVLSADVPYFLVAKNTADGIAKVDATGNVIGETERSSFAAPSSVRLGQPPLFDSSVWLVTEKGIVFGNGDSPKGNALSVFAPAP
jgi:hypothetical protein